MPKTLASEPGRSSQNFGDLFQSTDFGGVTGAGVDSMSPYSHIIVGHGIFWTIIPCVLMLVALYLSLSKVYSLKIAEGAAVGMTGFIVPFFSILLAQILYLVLLLIYTSFFDISPFLLQKMILASDYTSFSRFDKSPAVETMAMITHFVSRFTPQVYALIPIIVTLFGVFYIIASLPKQNEEIVMSEATFWTRLLNVFVTAIILLFLLLFTVGMINLMVFGNGDQGAYMIRFLDDARVADTGELLRAWLRFAVNLGLPK